jgi:hypothetical protein
MAVGDESGDAKLGAVVVLFSGIVVVDKTAAEEQAADEIQLLVDAGLIGESVSTSAAVNIESIDVCVRSERRRIVTS